MSSKPFDLKRDGGGLLLFVAGTFIAVLMVKSLASDEPLETLTGTAAVAQPFANSLGSIPSLLLAAGVAFLGARAFVTGSEARVLRHALGLVGCTLGLSILCGSFSGMGGGRLGLFSGGALAEALHPVLGGLLGLAVVFGSVWFVWLRNPIPVGEEQIRPTPAEKTLRADPGVTAAEAAGLIPEDLNHAAELARKSLRERIPAAPPPSPYPEDVRLKGQVPPGATPIQTAHASSTAPAPRVAAPESVASPAPRVQPVAARADLAAAAPAAAALAQPAAREVRPLPPGVRPLYAPDAGLSETSEDRVPIAEEALAAAPTRPTWEQTGLGEEDEPVDAYGTPLSLVESLRKAREELRAEPDEPIASAAPVAAAPIVQPSWEPDSLDLGADEPDPVAFDAALDELVHEEEEASLAVPLEPEPVAIVSQTTLVEVTDEDELESDEELESADELEVATPLELDAVPMAESEEFSGGEADADEQLAVEELAPVALLDEEPFADEDDLEDEDPLAEDEELEDGDDDEDEDEDADEDDEDLDDEFGAESLEEEELLEAEEDALESEEPLEEEELVEEELAPVEALADEPEAAEELADEPVAAAADHAGADAEPELAASEARAVAQTTIFDFTDASTPAVELFPEPAVAADQAPAVQAAASSPEALEESEPEVVLQPQPVTDARARKTLSVDPQRAKLLSEAGCLFVERGRVAVSMLQRQYGMDFDDACKVLDELQDLGLIGPYLGGQRRDILLTRDQWLEKVGAA